MSILASLARACERLPEAPAFGFSSEKIGFLISLEEDGSVAHVVDLRDGEGKRKSPRMMLVPQPVKRTAGIAPNTLWDKTSYVLGVTAGEGRRTADEHAAFVARHLELLGEATDAGLLALRRFLERWTPEQFQLPQWPEEMKDQNIVFALESDRLSSICLHDRPAARAMWARAPTLAEDASQICLVTGEAGPVARLHPSIKGVWGAQSSGAALVSFNLDAFTSYGHDQGDNAPVSEAAAFAYTTALNRFLARDSGHRVQIGDASTVFWADSSNAKAAGEAESLFGLMFEPQTEDAAAARRIGIQLERIRRGEPIKEIEPELEEGVRFFVVGLAPNAARLSIRFYFEDSFGVLAGNYQRFIEDMRIEPPPRESYPPLWKYLSELAVLGKRENVPPNLAGEWMRAILGGTRYPQTLLSGVLMRIRADGDINALRAGMLKAVINRKTPSPIRADRADDSQGEVPVALDPSNTDTAYVLGRLFAILEKIQTLALGKLGASIRDRYYGAASASPRTVFPLLLRLNLHHRSKAEKDDGSRGLAGYFSRQMGEVMNLLPTEFPPSLSLQEQGKFAIGYYHQFNYRKTDDADNKGESDK